MKTYFVAIFLIAVLALKSFALDLSAASAILYEPESETVLYERNIYEERGIASTTKIMTAVIVIENASPEEIVRIPRECVGIEGTSIYLREGECLSVSDLLYGMLLHSGNDAASALAWFVSEKTGVDFVKLMNDKARKIGMKSSSFKNPSGLPAEGHYSTAYDMSLLASYAMKNTLFADIVGAKTHSAGERRLVNHNKLLRLYAGANGIKTGYTKSAGRCLVSSAEKDGMSLIVVTLAAPDDWNDHQKLFDFGFSNFSVLKSENDKLTVSVVGGEKISAQIESLKNKSILVEKYSDSKTEIFLPGFVYAPIEKGEIIGEIRYIVDGEVVDKTMLICAENVKYKEQVSFFKRLFSF